MSLQRGLCLINQSLAAILKMTKWPKLHTPVINRVPTKSFACQNDANLRLISVGGNFSEIQDGRRQPSCFGQTTKKMFISHLLGPMLTICRLRTKSVKKTSISIR